MTYLIIVILAIACIISYFFVPTEVFAAFMIIWLGWSVYALMMKRRTEQNSSSSIFMEMRKNDRGHVFYNYISAFAKQSTWIDERMEVLGGFSETYVTLAEELKDSMEGNFEKANNYMRACDYNDMSSKKKYQEKIDALYKKNRIVLEKINELIEQLAEIENSADDVSTERVDDIIAALREMQL